MNRQKTIEQIVACFERLSDENKDRFIAALKAGIECNPKPLQDSRPTADSEA